MRSFKIRKRDPAGLFEDFIESERAKGSWPGNTFYYDIEVISTKALAGEFIETPEARETIIRPAVFHRTVGILLLVVAFYLWWFCFRVVIHEMFPVVVGLITVLVASAAITVIIIYFFVGKRYNYTLRIDGAGILWGRRRVAWGDLTETAIMWKRGRKTSRSWLLLFRRDGKVEKLRLGMFNISEDRLAAVVEQYKGIAG